MGESMLLEGFTEYNKEEAEKYNKFGWWSGITFGDMFNKAAGLFPEKEALVDDNNRLTYSQLREKVDKLAISLINVGIKKQERVLLQLPNWSEFVYSYFALQKIGAIVVLLIPRHSQIEISHFCHLTGAKMWIVPQKYEQVNYLPIIHNVLQENSELKNVILVRGRDDEQFPSLEGLIRDANLIEDNGRQLVYRRPNPMEVAHMGPTGGTTGLSKLVPRTHNSEICKIKHLAETCKLSSDDICLAVAPVGHSATFTVVVCGAIFACAKLILLDSASPEDICKAVEKEKITVAMMPPTLVMKVVNFEGLKDYDMSSLVKVIGGGATSPRELIQNIHEKIGCKYINAYGATEGTGCMTRLDYDVDTICNTVGKPTCTYDEYKIIDRDEKELAPNTAGELVVKGPSIFTGYFNAPEENEKAFAKDGFFKTGDLAIIDNSGDIRITSRIKDVILRGRETINPIEIEELIITHPDVEAVSVIGMPDEELGERVCAYIQPVCGAKLSSEDIISFLKAKAKGASLLQLPERIEFIESIPLTEVGKADKKALRADIKKRLEMA